MRVAFSSRARLDLLGIVLDIAERSPSAAHRVVDAIEARAQSLSLDPGRGRRMGPDRLGLRRLIEGSYVIIYRVGDEAVVIVRVLHGARDLDPALQSDGDTD
jgi:toxin ParE1/3/4